MNFSSLVYLLAIWQCCWCGNENGKSETGKEDKGSDSAEGTSQGASHDPRELESSESSKTEPPLLVTLDLSSPDHPQNVTVSPSFAGRTWVYYYTAKDGYPITKIVDGDTILWNGTTGSACTSAKFVSRGGERKHLVISIQESGALHEKFFVQYTPRDQWKELSRDDYEERFGVPEDGMVRSTESSRTPSVPENVEADGGESTESGRTLTRPTEPSQPSLLINIDGVNDDKIVVRESVESGVYHRKYRDTERLVSGSKVASVVAGNVPLWERQNFQVFKRCDDYSKGIHRLVCVHVNSLGLEKIFHFEKDGMQWTGISETIFNEKLCHMKEETETTTSAE